MDPLDALYEELVHLAAAEISSEMHGDADLDSVCPTCYQAARRALAVADVIGLLRTIERLSPPAQHPSTQAEGCASN